MRVLTTVPPLAPVEDVPRDDAESAAVARLRDALASARVSVPDAMRANGGETGVLLRFLRARKLDVDRALSMLRDTIAWREAHAVDALLDEPLDLDAFRANARMYPASYHGRDRLGRPVYVERTGSADFRALIEKMGPEGFLRMHLRAMEYQARVLLPRASRDAGFAVTQMCNVIDVGDLSLASTVSDASVLSALRTIADVDQAHYPENLGVTLVCNAPWSFRAAWSVVRVFLSAETQEKFVVLGAGETGKETLGKILGVDRVPAFLGGTCRCDGGCVCLDPVVGETKDVLTPAQVEYANTVVKEEEYWAGRE
jgi:hypothetical protein